MAGLRASQQILANRSSIDETTSIAWLVEFTGQLDFSERSGTNETAGHGSVDLGIRYLYLREGEIGRILDRAMA